MKNAATILMISLCLAGCATKRYGRAVAPSELEVSTYDCRELEIEISKVHAFQQQIKDGSKTNLASVMGWMGDFGIGNAMERSAAEKSASDRLAQLIAAQGDKSCPANGA